MKTINETNREGRIEEREGERRREREGERRELRTEENRYLNEINYLFLLENLDYLHN